MKIALTLKDGVVVIQTREDVAPKHVAQIKSLIEKGFYDGLPFHRVLDGFMAQGGCPNRNGTGGCGIMIEAEFNSVPHTRGAVSMARSQEPNSASSQFFICLKDSHFLNGQYTVWGQVIDGIQYIDNIKKGDPRNNGSVIEPDSIIMMRIIEE